LAPPPLLFVRCWHCEPWRGERDSDCLAMRTLAGLAEELDEQSQKVDEEEVRCWCSLAHAAARAKLIGARFVLRNLAKHTLVLAELRATTCTASLCSPSGDTSAPAGAFGFQNASSNTYETSFGSRVAIARWGVNFMLAAHTGTPDMFGRNGRETMSEARSGSPPACANSKGLVRIKFRDQKYLRALWGSHRVTGQRCAAARYTFSLATANAACLHGNGTILYISRSWTLVWCCVVCMATVPGYRILAVTQCRKPRGIWDNCVTALFGLSRVLRTAL
jgi:hypothetical protein